MNSYNIRKTLKKVVDDWKATLPDEFTENGGSLRRAADSVLITGGAIVSLLEGNPPNDYDVYFKTEESCKAIANYYSKLERDYDKAVKAYESAKAAGLAPSVAPVKPEIFVSWRSSNAISLSNKVQIITRFTGSAEEIHENFDYMHCMCVYDYSKNTLILPPDALECIINHELRWVNSKFPLCSLLRMNKFIRRGWHINAGQVVKICLAINELDLKNPFVLKEQLLGVDSMYFRQLFRALKDRDEVTVDEISAIIDEVFYGNPDSAVFMEPDEVEGEEGTDLDEDIF